MSLFNLFKREQGYRIVDWHGKEHRLTAKELYERVMEDCKSDYNWIASATELVRICNEFGFPQEYAQAIKIAILNCFANLETKKELEGYQEPTDADAVQFCYDSLADVSEEANKVRQKYLKAVIEGITRYHFRLLEFFHYGPTYHKICEEWKRVKFEEYSHISSLDFKKLRKALDDEFDKTMRTAEEEGVFQKDDEKNLEEMRTFWSSLDLDIPSDKSYQKTD